MTQQRKRKLRREAERPTPPGAVRVNEDALAPYFRFDLPRFVALGYYFDVPFVCRDCGEPQVWRAAQQKWWYEVAKGQVYSTAVRCRRCRAKARGGGGRPAPGLSS